MESEKRKYVYVVEGNTDEDKLRKLNVTYIVKTGGKFIRPEILLFLKEVYQKRKIVLLTDPDGPGRKIAEYIQSNIGECIVLNAEKKKAIYHDKVGIAQMKLEDIHSLLLPYLEHDDACDEEIFSMEDYIDLGMTGPNGKKKRMNLINKFHMPFTSAKNVYNAINMLSLSKEEIRKETTE